MIWSDFVAQVKDQISVDANRRGLAAFNDRFMRNAVLDLQRYIPGYRTGNGTTFGVGNVTQLGKCSAVALPTGALPKEIWMYELKTGVDSLCHRYRLDYYPWEKRQDLICGRLDFLDWTANGYGPSCLCPNPPTIPLNCAGITFCEQKGYVYAMAPHGKSFLVYPQVSSVSILYLIWDGYKTEFLGTDTIPFPDGASEAVAAYLKWRISLEVDKNIPLSREFQAAWKEIKSPTDTLNIPRFGKSK